ncbi:hypothetical protein Q9299_12185 [Gemmobacter fulvus]|uniref:hypothetical protein n=1 Tax=Gemmobacter fulvus TaxID=2840474 RepID=UPI0027965D68|nr:hypothetical protein [Gemmobacter fulvus]MDQ1849050.1 hypothetical protein [Gemmobacter fulvus]
MARGVFAGAVMVAGLVAAQGGMADPVSERLFTHKHWMVEIVGFDDGSFSCVAQVSDGDDTFSVWADPWNPVKLQFYSTSWDFSDGGSADLGVQVDRRSPWSLSDAELYQNSVLFNLPEGDASTRFLMEVVGGSTLHLSNDSGSKVQSYSLAGSSASIRALTECVDALADEGDGNPFN